MSLNVLQTLFGSISRITRGMCLNPSIHLGPPQEGRTVNTPAHGGSAAALSMYASSQKAQTEAMW